MIYFFNNDLELEKVVTSSNTLIGNHEHELNNLIRADVVLDLEHALSFIDDVDFFGYYYKDVFYLHKITRQETEHEAEVMVLAGRHIFFEDMLYSEVIKDIRPQNRDAKFMLDQAIGGHTRWNVVMTDVTGTLSTNFYWQMPYEALEWIVEHFRLEYLPVILFDGQKINGYELHVKKRLGENKGIRIPWGERVEKLNYEVDYSEIVTQLAPRGKGEEIGEDIYSRRINISDVNFSRDGVVSPVGNLYLEDKSLTAKYGNDGGKPRKGEGEFYDIDDVNELAEAGYQMYLDVSRPQVVISADVVDIGDVTIGDGVNIIRREHDLYFEARVHKISVDLLNPDDAQIELGDYEHFKESKVQKSNKKRIEIIEKEVYGQIHQYKIEFDENFNSVVNQWREEQEQALIDVHAEIEASEQRHDDKWEQYEAEIDGNIERIVGGSLKSLDTNLLDVNSRLLSKLDEADLQPLYGRIDDAFSDISDVSGNLDTTRSDLQKQLDEARAELEGIEVGGRNLTLDSNNFIDNMRPFPNTGARITTIEKSDNGFTEVVASGGTTRSKTFIGIFHSSERNSEYYGVEISIAFDFENTGTEPIHIVGNAIIGINRVIQPGFKGRVKFEGVTTFDYGSQQLHFRTDGITPHDKEIQFRIRNLMTEIGNKASDHQNAPEDTEEKITTLSESIEYIDGQLEAKLNRTEIEPIQNKITEYGTTLDANAESIGLLQEKTELHDDDIEQWSNQATSTAEEVSRILTHNSEQDDLITSVTNESRETAEGLERVINRVSETESGISTAKADIIANADLIGATMTRVDGNDRAIGDFQATADGLKADFSRYQSDFGDDMSAIQAQVASYEANVDGFRAEVGVLSKDVSSVESWQSEKGAVIDGNADAIRTRIWKQDIDAIEVGGRNLLRNSKEFIRSPSTTGYNYINMHDFTEEWIEGQEYTFSSDVEIAQGDFDVITVITRKTNGNSSGRVGDLPIINGRIEGSFVASAGDGRLYVYMGRSGETQNNQAILRNVKLEKGNKATDWTPAPEDTEEKITQLNTDITVEAGRINALLTRTSSVENSIADINTSVDGITADFASYKNDIDSDVGALSSQVASYEASVSGFRAEVGTLQGDINNVDSWIAQKGSIIDGNADAIRARVWNKDIDDLKIGGRNLLRKSNTDDLSDVSSWRVWQSDRTRATVGGKIFAQARTTSASSFGLQPGYSSGDRFEVVEGRDYIISFEGYTSLTSGDFDYTYLMRADGGNQGSLSPYKVEDAPLPGASNNKRYYFKLNANWSSTQAYLLIGARTKSQWRDTNEARWIRFRKPQIIEGTKEVPYSQAPENFLQHTDFILESDGFFLGGKYVGGDHYSTAIVGSKDGIDILASRMRVTGDLLVKGDVETYALDAVHGDITNLRSKLLTANVVKSTHLSVGSALANKFNASSAFISRLEVQAANIRDLTGIHIRGGLLESLNGRTSFNLDTGFLDMVNTRFRLGGGADIEFASAGNRLYYERRDGTTTRTSGLGVGTAINNRFPIVWMGTTGTTRGNFDPSDGNYFTGFISNTSGRYSSDGIQNSVVGNLFQVRDEVIGFNRGFEFSISGSIHTFRGMSTNTNDYNLGQRNAPFTSLFMKGNIHAESDFAINNRTASGSIRGWRIQTNFSGNGDAISLYGLNSADYNYQIGSRRIPAYIDYLYLRNEPRYPSDRRLKENIGDLNIGLDFINDLSLKEFSFKMTQADINQGKVANEMQFGLIAQEVVEVLGKYDVDINKYSIADYREDGTYDLQYGQLIMPTIKAVQDLDIKVESNAEKIARLEKEIKQLKGE